MFINKEETQLVVAIKNAILFNVPGSKIDQKKLPITQGVILLKYLQN